MLVTTAEFAEASPVNTPVLSFRTTSLLVTFRVATLLVTVVPVTFRLPETVTSENVGEEFAVTRLVGLFLMYATLVVDA